MLPAIALEENDGAGDSRGRHAHHHDRQQRNGNDLRALVGKPGADHRCQHVNELVDEHSGEQGRQELQEQHEHEPDARQNPGGVRVSGWSDPFERIRAS